MSILDQCLAKEMVGSGVFDSVQKGEKLRISTLFSVSWKQKGREKKGHHYGSGKVSFSEIS